MKEILTEINRNRRLMGLPVLTEGTGLAGILDAAVGGMENVMMKKITQEIVDKFASSFTFGSAGAKTRFINGGLASVKTALGKISRKEALAIIVQIDNSQIAKLASFIMKNEDGLVDTVSQLVQKGVPVKDIKAKLGTLTDIPDTVINTMIKNIELDVLFTPERIKSFAKAIETSSGKNLKKLTQEAIDAFRTSNPGATEQQIAEHMVKNLPDNFFSAKNVESLTRKFGSGFKSIFQTLLLNKERSGPSWWKILGLLGASTTIAIYTAIGDHISREYIPDAIDILEKNPKYNCYAKYVTPGKDKNHFVVVEPDNTRAIIKFDNKRFWYVDKNDTPIKELSCND